MSDHLQTLEGKIEPIELEDEMRSSFIDYAMSVIIDRALPDVRDGLKPSQRRILVRHERSRPRAQQAAPQVRQDRRRHLRQLPPPRRGRHLPDPRAHGAGLQHALPAGRRPGQLRLRRRRLRRRPCATPRRASARSPSRCCATSTTTPSTGCPTTTRPGASPRCCRAACPTCWSTAPRASPSAWRPTSRRTTSARSSTRSCI